jgi:ABC-type nitrate/sulfonate/bicarbonate transport system ATPase subunit
VRAVADSALNQVGLAGLGERLPHQLSGGERQRLAIARALAGESRWLLLDEPFSSLDPLSKRRVGRLLRSLQADLDLGILYVTHDLHEAAALADRIVLMQRGRLVGARDLEATGTVGHEELLQWYERTVEPA